MSDYLSNVFAVRVIGTITLVASIVQIGIAGGAYSMTSWNVGAWWAGLGAFIASIFALISNSRNIFVAGCVFSVISIILLIVGIILDGIGYGVTNSLDTCYDQDRNDFFGAATYQDNAQACVIDHSQTCLCVNGGNSDTCYLFNLESADNCGEILTTMPALLLVSLLIMLAMFVTMLTYSIFTCKIVCCTEPDVPRSNTQQQQQQPTPAAVIKTIPASAVTTVPMTNKV